MSDFNTLHNRYVWMDIPVADLDRAIAFYRGVMAVGVTKESFDETTFGLFEHDEGNGGCLVIDPDAISDSTGPLVYLNVNGRIREAVEQVIALGGKVTQDVHSLGPHGFRALIIDSEGNRFALHSQ